MVVTWKQFVSALAVMLWEARPEHIMAKALLSSLPNAPGIMKFSSLIGAGTIPGCV